MRQKIKILAVNVYVGPRVAHKRLPNPERGKGMYGSQQDLHEQDIQI